jgi:hypothetical protein
MLSVHFPACLIIRLTGTSHVGSTVLIPAFFTTASIITHCASLLILAGLPDAFITSIRLSQPNYTLAFLPHAVPLIHEAGCTITSWLGPLRTPLIRQRYPFEAESHLNSI